MKIGIQITKSTDNHKNDKFNDKILCIQWTSLYTSVCSQRYIVDTHHTAIHNDIVSLQAVRNEADLNCMAVPVKYRKMNTFYKVHNIMHMGA